MIKNMQTDYLLSSELNLAFKSIAKRVEGYNDVTHSNTPWHRFSGDIDADEFIVFGDANAALIPCLKNIDAVVHLWHPTTDIVSLLSNFPNIQILRDKNKMPDVRKESRCVIRTNVAFTITKEMIVDVYPVIDKVLNVTGTQTVLPSYGVLSIPGANRHQDGVDILKSLKAMGLKTVKHLPIRFFERIEEGKLDAAQTGIIYVETEKGYDGDITVHCLKTNTSYIASRSASMFPRSELAYKIGQMTQKSNLPKGYLSQNATPAELSIVQNLFTIEISHYGNGYKDPATGEFCSLPNANLVMPGVGNYKHDHLLFGFSTETEAKSFQSLLRVPEFVTSYIDNAFKKQIVSGPTLKLVSQVFPWDRIWDSQQLLAYV